MRSDVAVSWTLRCGCSSYTLTAVSCLPACLPLCLPACLPARACLHLLQVASLGRVVAPGRGDRKGMWCHLSCALWVPEIDQFVRIRLSTRAMRSIAKMGFVAFCQKNGIDVIAAVADSQS